MARKRKQRTEEEQAPPAQHEKEEEEEEEEEEDQEADDDGDEDSDDEALNLGNAESEETLSVDFGFFDPKASDFHGVRALLLNSSSLQSLGKSWDVSGLADLMCEQVEVGSVAKVIGEGKEEPADDDVLGFMSAINLHTHRSARFAQELRASLIKRCADSKTRDELTGYLAHANTGLIVSERLVNLPAALVPSLVDSLLQDIDWASQHAEGAAACEAFRFSQLLLVAPVSLSTSGGESSGAGGSSDANTSMAAPGKKKKKRANEAADARAALLESVAFERTEEEILAAAADWCALLNGSGRSRQVVMLLRPAQIRDTLPALHGAMGES